MSLWSEATTDVENGADFAPRFGPDGLLTCVTVDAHDGAVLMLAHMNAEALEKSLETGIVHYWSRSRGQLWRKGDTSGQIQRLKELRVDCDQDALLAVVEVGGDGGACHTGRRSCFYRRVTIDKDRTRLSPAEGRVGVHAEQAAGGVKVGLEADPPRRA